MTSLFKTSLPFFKTPLVGCHRLMVFAMVGVFVPQGLALGLGVRGHNALAVSLVFALATFLMVLPPPVITRLRSLGKFSRGLVEVFLIAPFHGGNRSTE